MITIILLSKKTRRVCIGETGRGRRRQPYAERRRRCTRSEQHGNGGPGEGVRRWPRDTVHVGTARRGPSRTPAGGQPVPPGLQQRTPEPGGVRHQVPGQASSHVRRVRENHFAYRVPGHDTRSTLDVFDEMLVYFLFLLFLK